MFPYKKPLMTACVEHKFSTLNKMNFLSWCADAHATLNFDINKNMLLHDIHDISGLSKRNIISSSATSQEPHSYQGNRDVSYISEDVAYIIPTLLVMDADMRKIVASPVLSSASQEYAMSICGCSTPDDEDVLYAVVSGKRDNVDKNALAYAYSLYPENTEDDYDFSVTAQYLARSLLFSWRYEQKCKPVVSYIPLLQHIASHNSGADGLDQLSFVFEVIAETAMTQ